jgi:hypothetical protein
LEIHTFNLGKASPESRRSYPVVGESSVLQKEKIPEQIITSTVKSNAKNVGATVDDTASSVTPSDVQIMDITVEAGMMDLDLHLEYPMHSMKILEENLDKLSSTTEEFMVLEQIRMLCGYDILPINAIFSNEEDRDFFTGMLSNIQRRD